MEWPMQVSPTVVGGDGCKKLWNKVKGFIPKYPNVKVHSIDDRHA